MKKLLLCCAGMVLLCGSAPSVCADFLFRSIDPLSQRDAWGVLHQSPSLEAPDWARRRFLSRLTYNVQSGRGLSRDPAYVGALQVALRRNGYYCGEIDGIFSEQVCDAIARLQKNHSMRVTGNLTIPVRRALHLP